MGTDVNPDISKDSDKTVSGSDDTFSGNTPLGSQPNNSPDIAQESGKKNKSELTTLKTSDMTKIISQIELLRDGLNNKYFTIAGSVSKLENDNSKLVELSSKIQNSLTISDAVIGSLVNKINDVPSTKGYTQLFFILPPFLLLFAIIGLGYVVKPISMDSVNERIEKLSINITENSPKSQINKLKDDITGIKNSFDEVNKKGVSEIKELIAKTGNLTTLSENINALKTSIDKLSTNPLNKNELDEIKNMLKNIGDNKSTIIPPQLIGQPTELSKFAKEFSAELVKSKGFSDEIVKSSNQSTKEALKSVDDKIKLISDSIKINPKTDKTEDILKSIDGNFKSILESINKNPKQVISKPNHPFLLICSTTPTFNPDALKNLKLLFEDLTKTIRETNRNIDWKIGLEYSSNFIPWFENDKKVELSVENFGKAEPVFSSNFLNDIILAKELKNNILSDVIIIVPLGTGGGLKTNGGTPIFMNGVRVHVIYLALAKEKNTITESMLGWSKFAATNGGGTFSVLTIIEGPGGKPNEEDLAKQVKDHVLKLVQKFSY